MYKYGGPRPLVATSIKLEKKNRATMTSDLPPNGLKMQTPKGRV